MKSFPCTMKCAEISPLFKKDDNLSRDNYWPVNVLTVISKIFETLMNDELTDYFQTILNKLSCAFCKKYSCQSLQCSPDISRSCISQNWIYRGHMLDTIFWRPRTQYFSRNRGNSLDPIRGRQFFAKFAHRDPLCSRSAGDHFSQNQL